MLTVFRTNQIFTNVLLVFYILLLRFSVFIADFEWFASGEGLFSKIVYDGIGSQTIWAQIVSILLLLIQGFLVNSIVVGNRMSNEANLFPGVFYVLISSALPDFLYLSPVLIGNTFVLIALVELFSIYKVPSCADRIFNVGFWIGIAGLFYFPFLMFFIFVFAGLNILRAFNIRERLMAFVGLIMPYLLVALYFYATGRLEVFWEIHFTKNFGFFNFGSGGVNVSVKLVLFALLLIYVIFENRSYFAKKNIQVQKKISILYWILISALIGAFFQNNLSFEHFLMLAPPLGIFLGFSFTNMKSQWAESIHFLLVIGALALQFVPWLF